MVGQFAQLADIGRSPNRGAVHFNAVLEFLLPGKEVDDGKAGQELVA